MKLVKNLLVCFFMILCVNGFSEIPSNDSKVFLVSIENNAVNLGVSGSVVYSTILSFNNGDIYFIEYDDKKSAAFVVYSKEVFKPLMKKTYEMIKSRETEAKVGYGKKGKYSLSITRINE